MKFLVLVFVLLSSRCHCVPVEETVVSVYTTHPTTAGTSPPLDVYHQIANNIAERITSPIYRLLGLNSSIPTVPEATTRPPWDKIELLDDQDLENKRDMKPVDNNIETGRDVEELSVEGITKAEKKPEKITLYSSLVPVYLPALERSSVEKNETTIPDDFDSLELDDVEETKPREGPLIYIMEFLGSIIQLLWGGFMALFRPPSTSDNS